MTGEQLRLVVYVSTAVHKFDTAELDKLLSRSRAWNADHGITGMLLHYDGNFMQALEGPPDAVEEVLARVRSDIRHYGIILMVNETITIRRFAGWYMGFRRPKDDALPEGWSDFLQRYDEGETDGDIAVSMLESFRRNLQ